MKYKDVNTGEVYDNLEDAHYEFCNHSDFCKDCLLNKYNHGEIYNNSCEEFVREFMDEAMVIMGLASVYEEGDHEKEKAPEHAEKVPVLCEILGVKPDELFMFYGLDNHYRIHNGIRENKAPAGSCWVKCASEETLCEMLNHPERVRHTRCVTIEEKYALRMFANAYPDGLLTRSALGLLCFHMNEKDPGKMMAKGLFPNISNDSSLYMKDIESLNVM